MSLELTSLLQRLYVNSRGLDVDYQRFLRDYPNNRFHDGYAIPGPVGPGGRIGPSWRMISKRRVSRDRNEREAMGMSLGKAALAKELS